MLSRVLGLVREQVFAHLLGAGFYTDAFVIAFRIPNLMRDLFAEGALSAAFVPAYARALREGGPEGARRFASRVVTALSLVLAVLMLVGLLGAEVIVRLMARGFDAEQTELAALLTRIMWPFLPLVSFAAVTMGMLNAEERFGMPALAPAMFNVVSILSVFVISSLHLGPRGAAIGWSIATVLGGLAQLLIQLPPLWRTGWRFRLDWAPHDPELRRIAQQMAPATLGMAAVQINIFVSGNFASEEEGAITWLQFAFRILYLPIGLFGVALGTVAATSLARLVANGETSKLGETIGRSLRNLTFLSLPSTVGLAVLATPIVRLLFEHGAFAKNPVNTTNTATALAIYSLGMVAYATIKVLAPAFYAMGRPRVPLLASACAVIANLLTIVALHPFLGYRGIAAGLVISTFVNVLVLGVILRRSVGPLGGNHLGGFLVRVMLACAVMGAVADASRRALEAWLGTQGVAAQAAGTLVPVALGAGLYLGLTSLLGVAESRALWRALLRRRA